MGSQATPIGIETERGRLMAVIENVHESEVEDFVNELRRAKRSLDEFEIKASPKEPLTRESGVISPTVGAISIRNKQTGAERTYRTGHVSTWIMDAIADIKTGEL